MRRYIYIILLSLAACCCGRPDRSIKFVFENNLSIDIEFLYPRRFPYAVPFAWGTMYDLSPNDTTSTAAWHAHFARMSLLPNSSWPAKSGFGSIEDMSPYDTVRIFVFDARFYHLPYYEGNLDEIFESEDYLCRYDLTKKDLYGLVDFEGNIKISFPPSLDMRNVKMWPKYEEVCMFKL